MKRRLKQLIQPVLLAATLVAALVQLLALPVQALGLEDVPEFLSGGRNWVMDISGVLSRDTEGRLNRLLDDLERATGQAVRVVTARRLDYGETPDSLVSELFTQWFEKPTDQAHQTVLLLDTRSRGAAIQAGEDVQPLLPTDLIESITEETMGSQLRQGNLNQALLDGVSRLSTVLSGQADPGPPQMAQLPQAESSSTFPKASQGEAAQLVVWLLAASVIIPMATYFAYKIWS